MKKSAIFLAVFCFLAFASCQYGLQEVLFRDSHVNLRAANLLELAAPQDFQNQNSPAPLPSVYKVAVITDVHFGANKKRFDEKFLTWLENSGAKFVICLGDFCEHGTENEGEEFRIFSGKVKSICGQEIYTIAGNHDLYNSGWNTFQQKTFPGTSFYKFSTNKFSWYFTDSASGFLGKPQIAALKASMFADTKPKIVLTHIPLYSRFTPVGYFAMQNTQESDVLLSLFANTNVKIVLEGHTHKHEKIPIGNYVLYNVPGYLETRTWTLLTVDETNRTLATEVISYD